MMASAVAIPTLSYRRRELQPARVSVAPSGRAVWLYFAEDAELPGQAALTEQLERQGWTLRGFGWERGTRYVVAVRA